MTPSRSKSCKACGTPWSADLYAGITCWCKECWKSRVKERRRTNPAVQEYERERAKQPHRRDKSRRLVANWRKNFPDKYAALTALGNAIRDGKAKRGRACACGATTNLRGVHLDYSKPLDVIWKCATCQHRDRFAVEEAS